MHLTAPVLLSAVLAGIGAYGVLARRNAVLVLIGVELLLSSANVLLVAMSTQERPYVLSETTSVAMYGGQVMTIFIITLAAAEIVVALAIVQLGKLYSSIQRIILEKAIIRRSVQQKFLKLK